MSGERELTRLVILDGVAWPAGSVPPAEVAARITNPLCWQAVEDEPGLPWGPEGTPKVSTASQPVIPAAPATGITNLDEKSGDSAVPDASPGTVIARSDLEYPVGEYPLADDKGDQAQAGPEVLEPPRSGQGASTAAWQTFARQHEVEVASDATRSEIIAACQDAGVIQ